VVAHSLLIQVIAFSIRPTLSYAALEAGIEPAALGLLSAAFALPGVLLAIPTGRLTDRLGERTIVVVGAVLMLVSPVIALLGQGNLAAIVVATAVLGTGHLISVVGDQAILANRTLASARDGVFAGYAFSISLGQGIGGALLSLNALDSATPDIPLQFWLSTALAAATVVAAVLFRSSRRHAPNADDAAPVGMIGLVRSRGVVRAVLASSLVVTAMEISIVYFPAIGYERGFGAATVSAMLVARAIASMVSRFGLEWQVRVVGRRRLMVTSIAISAVMLAALALPLGAGWLIAICAVFGFSAGVSQPLTLSWLSEIAPAGRRGMVMSLRIATNRVAQAVVPLGLGAFGAVAGGASGVLLATAALVGVSSWLSAAIGASPPAEPPAEPGREEPL
jgi:MFS family permease